MKKIIISKNLYELEVEIFNGISIREVPIRKKLKNGTHTTEFVDIRTLKIGADLDGGILIQNDFL